MATKKPDFYTVEPCASSHAYEIRLRKGKINLDRVNLDMAGKEGAGNASENACEVFARTPVILMAKTGKCSLSIFASGRIMLKGIGKTEAVSLAREIMKKLADCGAIDEN
jgi:TATA-box binding protein (TBP) (component of TFIID and TFIIIB)